MSLVECFRAVIDSRFHLENNDKDGNIVIQEVNNTDGFSLTFVGIKNIESFGFSAESG